MNDTEYWSVEIKESSGQWKEIGRSTNEFGAYEIWCETLQDDTIERRIVPPANRRRDGKDSPAYVISGEAYATSEDD